MGRGSAGGVASVAGAGRESLIKQVVIIGAGQAGFACAAKLRAEGFEGDLTLVGDEAFAPYQRPPLSKAYLLGKLEAGRLFFRPDPWYEAQNIRLMLGAGVTQIDRVSRQVALCDGKALEYDALVLATGAAPRNLPDSLLRGLGGVFTIRDRADVELLRPELDAARNVLVIGGGYIGLEMAAVASGLGKNVVVVEAAPAILGRVASAETAGAIAALHDDHGVKIICGQGVSGLMGETRVTGARLADGEEIAADLVVVGVGAAPRTALAEAAGLEISNGILADPSGRTSDPAIYAAGDCACYRLETGDLRLESVGNAIDTGEVVARKILGGIDVYVPNPWFWSDQFDLKLQIAGSGSPGDEIVTREAAGEGWSHWYFREGRLVAVDALSSPRAYQAGRRMIIEGLTPSVAELADPAKSIKDVFDRARAASAVS